MLDDEVAHIATHALDVPVRSAQQPLHSIRNPLTSAFGQSPPVLTFQTRDQTRLYCRVDSLSGTRHVEQPTPISAVVVELFTD